MKRRKFILTLLGTTAIGWAGWTAIPSRWNSGTSTSLAPLKKVSKSGHALGTKVVITVFHHDEAVANKAISDAFAAIEHVEQLMSLYRSDSQLSQLNRNGFLADPDPELVQVLERATLLSKQSHGAFDITVQPLWKAYQEAALEKRLPTEAALSSALQKVDWRNLKISRDAISLSGKGMAITLNGIAQGFAADAASHALKANGIENALIDSGEIGTVGTHAQKDGWTIGIKHPREPQEFLGLASLQGRCLATSGDYESSFSDDFRNHHLLDPRSGHSPLELSSVSIVAPTAMEADALSTAVFLMGLHEGKALVESLPDVDALFVDKSNRLTQTTSFPIIESLS